MRNCLFLIIVLISCVIQVTILGYFKIFGVSPDLLLITVVLASLVFDFRVAVFLSMTAGVLQDIFGIGSFGINTLMFSLWSFVITQFSRSLSLNTNPRRIILMFMVTLMHNLFCGLSLVFSNRPVPLGIFLRILTIGSIYTAILIPLVFKVSNLALKPLAKE